MVLAPNSIARCSNAESSESDDSLKMRTLAHVAVVGQSTGTILIWRTQNDVGAKSLNAKQRFDLRAGRKRGDIGNRLHGVNEGKTELDQDGERWNSRTITDSWDADRRLSVAVHEPPPDEFTAGSRNIWRRSGTNRSLCPPTGVRAVQHLVPHLLPFLPPSKGPPAGKANLRRQIGFAMFRHGSLLQHGRFRRVG